MWAKNSHNFMPSSLTQTVTVWSLQCQVGFRYLVNCMHNEQLWDEWPECIKTLIIDTQSRSVHRNLCLPFNMLMSFFCKSASHGLLVVSAAGCWENEKYKCKYKSVKIKATKHISLKAGKLFQSAQAKSLLSYTFIVILSLSVSRFLSKLFLELMQISTIS